jgi:hypothetical protein
MALLPLGWVAIHRERRVEWWWLAGMFAVSWLADAATIWSYPTWVPVTVYPMSQAALAIAVIEPRPRATLFVGVLALATVLTVLIEGVQGPTLFLETVAAGLVVGIVWPMPLGRLRVMLLTAFGLGWVAWVGYVLDPSFGTWGVVQAVRAVSIGMFCWATQSRPALRLA